MKRQKGSITVFLALTLVLITALIFSLLEAARVKSSSMKARLIGERSAESLFSGYEQTIWEEYGLLLYPGGGEKGRFKPEKIESALAEYAMKNLDVKEGTGIKRGMDFLKEDFLEAEVLEYELAYDGEGRALQGQITELMKDKIPAEAAGKIRELLRTAGKYGDETKEEQILQEARQAEKEADGIRKEQEGIEEGGEQKPEEASEQKNPLEIFQLLKKQPLLNLVLEKPEKVSNLSMEKPDRMEERELNQGTMEGVGGGWYEDVLLLLYLKEYVTCFTSEEKDHPLAYEMEYLIGGKDSDKENLNEAVKQILLIRELANFTFLMGDRGKNLQAESIAVGLVGFTGMVPLIQAVKAGILLAWAYVEGIRDVRILLQGGKVSLLKTTATWTTDLMNLKESREPPGKNQEEGAGLSYPEYLIAVLSFKNDRIIRYRFGDLIEEYLSKKNGEKVFLDTMLQSMTCSMKYRAKPLFAKFIGIETKQMENYKYSKEVSYSYIGE